MKGLMLQSTGIILYIFESKVCGETEDGGVIC